MSIYSAKQYQRHNYLQSVLLLLAMLGLLAFIGHLIAGITGALMAAIMVLIILIAGPRFSPYFILRLYRAQLISPAQSPYLYDISSQLAQKAGIEFEPTLYYLPSQVINAFTIGLRKDACIVISDGMLRKLNKRELIAVLAHEISHISNHDLFVMWVADVLSRLTSILALCGYLLILFYLPLLILYQQFIPWLLMLILIMAPYLSSFLQLALSRTREYNADLAAAQLTSDPMGLASALKKIDYYQHNWFERIFFPARQVPDPSLLRTHPTLHSRIKRLNNLAKEMSYQSRSESQYLNHWLDQTPREKPRRRISGLWY